MAPRHAAADTPRMQETFDFTRGRPRFARTGSTLEQAFVRARLARAPRQRVAASVLETTTLFVPAALALLYEVDGHGVMDPVMARRGDGEVTTATDDLARRLVALEPIDPFSVRRAQGMARSTLSAQDVGGEDELSRTMFGRHLRRLELATPAHAYLWGGDRIVAGIVLLRGVAEAPFTPVECLLLARIAPLLADALVLGRCAGAQLPVLPEDRLTDREREVAWLVLAGVRNAGIAQELEMSEATVKTHLTRIYAKLDIRGRTELATRFRRCESSEA